MSLLFPGGGSHSRRSIPPTGMSLDRLLPPSAVLGSRRLLISTFRLRDHITSHPRRGPHAARHDVTPFKALKRPLLPCGIDAENHCDHFVFSETRLTQAARSTLGNFSALEVKAGFMPVLLFCNHSADRRARCLQLRLYRVCMTMFSASREPRTVLAGRGNGLRFEITRGSRNETHSTFNSHDISSVRNFDNRGAEYE